MTPFVLRIGWRRGLFAHWPVDHDALRPHVPAPLELDTRDGRAWIGVLAFEGTNLRPRGLPAAGGLTVPELNVRTYVTYDGDPGVYFFAIDVDSRLLAMAVRLTTALPYRHASIELSGDGDWTAVRYRKSATGDGAATFAARYRSTGPASHAKPGTRTHWLVERYRLFEPTDDGLRRAELAHDPWSIQPVAVDIRENTLFRTAGLPEPTGDPDFAYATDQSMLATLDRPVERPRLTAPVR